MCGNCCEGGGFKLCFGVVGCGMGGIFIEFGRLIGVKLMGGRFNG